MSNVVHANLVAHGFKENIIFDLTHPWNRDNCFNPYYLLREKLKNQGVELNTADVNFGKPIIFELHINVQKQRKSERSYLLMLETTQICPENGVMSNWDCYRKIFTWNDELVARDHLIKISFPNPICVLPVNGFESRDRFCCLISGNKTLVTKDECNLYPERVKAIRWFEQHAPQDFDLFGVDWNMPVLRQGLFGKMERRIFRALGEILKLRPFPSYQGTVEHKREVLERTRFSICYENVRDLPGYITEKIFDCFFSGCVPVYWGASNITNYIPEDCFIDRRKFYNTEDVYNFLKKISDDDFIGYQQRIAAFLLSDAAYQFSSEYFAETIVNTIVQDIGNQE